MACGSQPPQPRPSCSQLAHTTQCKRCRPGRSPTEKATARVSPSHTGHVLGPGWGQSRNLSCSSSDYCGQPALLLSPDLGLQAVEASPVSAALRELLGLTEALRVP